MQSVFIDVLTAHRRVRPERSATLCKARITSPRSLADGLLLRLHAECVGAGLAPAPFGGPSGIRTHDLLNAIETRSQLRYGPSMFVPVDLAGFEPATSSVRLKRAPNCATGPLLVAKLYRRRNALSSSLCLLILPDFHALPIQAIIPGVPSRR